MEFSSISNSIGVNSKSIQISVSDGVTPTQWRGYRFKEGVREKILQKAHSPKNGIPNTRIPFLLKIH